MATYVHLTRQGNERLAKAIANTLVETPAFREPSKVNGTVAKR
jgi:hypothetical protein